jgi:hypothetical protein
MDWISQIWAKYLPVNFCAKDFFIVYLKTKKIEIKPWKQVYGSNFYGRSTPVKKPWFPYFNPASVTISTTPTWVRLPNSPVNLWQKDFEVITNYLANAFSSINYNSKLDNGLRLYLCGNG